MLDVYFSAVTSYCRNCTAPWCGGCFELVIPPDPWASVQLKETAPEFGWYNIFRPALASVLRLKPAAICARIWRASGLADALQARRHKRKRFLEVLRAEVANG